MLLQIEFPKNIELVNACAFSSNHDVDFLLAIEDGSLPPYHDSLGVIGDIEEDYILYVGENTKPISYYDSPVYTELPLDMTLDAFIRVDGYKGINHIGLYYQELSRRIKNEIRIRLNVGNTYYIITVQNGVFHHDIASAMYSVNHRLYFSEMQRILREAVAEIDGFKWNLGSVL